MKFNFAPDYQHRMLWYFFAFALGCATYFGISFEPNLWILLTSAITVGAAYMWRRWMSIGIVLFVLLGMSVSSIRTHMVTTSMLDAPLWRQTMSGFVVDKVTRLDRQVIVLDRVWSKNNLVPDKIRLTLYDTKPEIQMGDWIKIQAHLFPAGDVFAQRLFFQGVGAQGKVLRVFKIRHKEVPLIDRTREHIIDRIGQVLPYSSAQIATPLVTGEQRIVSQEMYDIYRKAGIAHILSVSGFHMALLAGFIFFFIRGLLCLIPYVALRINTKKIAAAVALGVTFLYLLLSGVQIPALRSFLMISVVLIAVLLDRRAFSLYTLLLVGFGMLCVRPEWIMSISFQFSFVAMMGLVSLFSQTDRGLKSHRIMHFIWALIGANLLIEFLLMPYVMYHFNQINIYGVVGNLAVSFLFSFCVMPLLFIACLVMPFGWYAPFLKGAGWMLDHISVIADWVGQLPYAEILVPSFDGAGLWIVSVGLGMLCLMQHKERLLGLGVIMCGLFLGYLLVDKPDMIIADGGKTILVRGADNYFYSNQKNVANWNLKRWLKKNGQSDALMLTTDMVTLANQRIVLSGAKCTGADWAILSGKNKKCGSAHVFKPEKYVSYKVFADNGIFIERENAAMEDRMWFQRKGKK